MTRKFCAEVSGSNGYRFPCGFAGSRLTVRFSVLALVLLTAANAAHAAADENIAAQLKQAILFHQEADYAHSIPILHRIVQQSPGNYLANLLLGEDLLNSGNIAGAISPLEIAGKLRPKDGTAEVFLAEAEVAKSDFAGASEALLSGVARSGEAAPFEEAWASFCLQRFRIVEMQLRSTKRGEATALRVEAAVHPEGSKLRESLLEESATGDPEQRGIWGELGVAQLELGMGTQVQQSLQETQTRDPQGAATLQLEALIAATQQNWPVAEDRLTALGELSPAEMRGAVDLWLHIFAPRYPVSGTAWACLQDAAIRCPTVIQPRKQKARNAQQLYIEGRWEKLIALPLPASANTAGWLWRGVALARIDKCSQAIPALESGLKADEQTADFWLDVCYANEGEGTVGRLSQQGNTTALHQLRGDILLQLHEDAAGAESEYAEALKSKPDDPVLLEKQAEAYMQLGNTAEAQKAALAALAVDAHQFSALQTLALIAISDRNYAEARTRLKQLLAIDPKNGWIRTELGVAYAQLGDPQEAVHYLGSELAAGYPDKKGALHAMLASALGKLGRESEAQQAAAEAARLANSALEGGENGGTHAIQ